MNTATGWVRTGPRTYGRGDLKVAGHHGRWTRSGSTVVYDSAEAAMKAADAEAQ